MEGHRRTQGEWREERAETRNTSVEPGGGGPGVGKGEVKIVPSTQMGQV